MNFKKTFFVLVALTTISTSAMGEESRTMSSAEVLAFYGKYLRSTVAPQTLTDISKARGKGKEFEALHATSTTDLIKSIPNESTDEGESMRTLPLREQLAFLIGSIKHKLQNNGILSAQEKELVGRSIEAK